jgi:hypothetical protein
LLKKFVSNIVYSMLNIGCKGTTKKSKYQILSTKIRKKMFISFS